MKKVISQHWLRQLIKRLCIDLGLCVLIGLWIFSFREVKAENRTVKAIDTSNDFPEVIDFSLLYSCGKVQKTYDSCLEISFDDAQRLMKIAVVEDYTNAESQAWIMQTILNRVNDPSFPNTIQEVIEQPGQFSTVNTGEYKNAVPNVDSHLALCLIETRQIKSDALYFEASWAENTWQSKHRKFIATIGGTKYYK